MVQATPETRRFMVERQIAARGVRAPAVLRAMERVPREEFVPDDVKEFAYRDAPLPIGEEQTISQPYIVAHMIEALALRGGEHVLEVGTGSGYAAAVLAEIAAEVWTVERHASLAAEARARLERLGYRNVHVIEGDGTLGWIEDAPYDAILVSAGGPDVPRPLRAQLAPGGRIVIPVGATPRRQRLLRLTRRASGTWNEEVLEDVQFVPLVGVEGWDGNRPAPSVRRALSPADVVRAAAEPFDDLESADLSRFLARARTARLLLLGEATHGTSEFYRMRARITRERIRRHECDFVAVEADWPDAAGIDRYVRHKEGGSDVGSGFRRFPSWMWRNEEVREFVEWLREENATRRPAERVGFHGLDLYSMYASIEAVLAYLDRTDTEAAAVARRRYGCLTPWEADPAAYGLAATTGRFDGCADDAARMLKDLLGRRIQDGFLPGDREELFDAVQNARLVHSAEQYYRLMYRGTQESWNLRDRHMFDCLEALLRVHGQQSKCCVWAHNSHLGDARATEFAAGDELNLGQLCRESHGAGACLVGFGTDHGQVAAAAEWDGALQIMDIRPAHEESHERICHDTGLAAFLLPLRGAGRAAADVLRKERLERAIGVVYRPQTELASHWFDARLADQFDEWIWLDATSAVRPLPVAGQAGPADTWPFGE